MRNEGQFGRGVQYALVNRYSSFGGEVEGRDDVPLLLGCSILLQKPVESASIEFNHARASSREVKKRCLRLP
jgi:hypothetical protein